MSLLSGEEVRVLLVCPRCRSALVHEQAAAHCASPGCALHSPGSFPLVGEQPVLVDFDHSVVRRDSLATGPPGTEVDRLPRFLRGIWKPRNRSAELGMRRMLHLLPGPAPVVLVIGGATVGNGVSVLYTDPRVALIGFDIVRSAFTQFVADAHRIPLPDACVDAVLVQAVLEHVLDPQQVVAEIHRVLRKRGLVYAETPFLQQVHAGPYDFTRFTASGHRYLFRRFDEIEAGSVTGPGTQLLWDLDHLARGLTRSAAAGRATRGLLFWLRRFDMLVPPRYASDAAGAHYFLGRRRERNMTPAEIIGYYPGAQ